MTDPTPHPRPFAAVILAAGKGTRMKSDLHKVLHPLAGLPMIEHLLFGLESLGAARTVVVVGAGREQVEPIVVRHGGEVVIQDPQLGTAHAVLQAKPALDGFDGDVIVLYADTPLVTSATMTRMLDRLGAEDAPGAVVVASRPANALRYGRVIAEGDRILRMVEWKDATINERAIDLCNSGLLAARARDLWIWLDRVGNDNAAGEYYLPDAVMLAIGDGRGAVVVEVEPVEVAGVNSRAELAELELGWQHRRRLRAMEEGASLRAPDTVWFSHDTRLGRDVTVEANVVFGPGVGVADGAHIRAFSHLEGAQVGPGCEVGPYARLRPGTVLDRGAKIGNFVETKKAHLHAGAKANHLTYLGDAEVGRAANIGAGTITCNYDGFGKYPTHIGAGAFIGSNSALVAPVSIGEGAIVGAGSVVTEDVEADALALARGKQEVRPGWAARFRERMIARKTKT